MVSKDTSSTVAVSGKVLIRHAPGESPQSYSMISSFDDIELRPEYQSKVKCRSRDRDPSRARFQPMDWQVTTASSRLKHLSPTLEGDLFKSDSLLMRTISHES